MTSQEESDSEKASKSSEDVAIKESSGADAICTDAALSELDDIDKTYNIVSDTLFFLGSVCYLTVTDWRSHYPVGSVDTASISFISLLGPLLYLFNANVEICWAIHNMRRHHGESIRRREATWDLFSNLFFGLGAIIDVAMAVNHRIRPGDAVMETDLRSLSVLVYFMSGVVSIAGFNPSCLSCYQFLIGTGDVLFLTGSISDLCLSVITRGISNADTINSFWLISATLWLVNSILYLLADLLAYIRWRKSRGSWLKASTTDVLDSLELTAEQTDSCII
jgi:hypothetical protein